MTSSEATNGTQPLFTVIVPTHERPLLLRRTLRSLIAQKYQNFHVIVVDDSPAYIPPYEEFAALPGRYTYIIRSGVSGPAESRNMAVAVSPSKYVIFLDDDDTFEPEHLGALAAAMEGSCQELYFSSFKVCHENRAQSPPEILRMDEISISDVSHDSIFVRNRIPNSCLVYRRDVVATLLHDTNMPIYEDWDFLLACLPGRALSYIDINSVVIHKSQATAPENMRRGNARNDLTVEVMLQLYRKHPAPNAETRLARKALLASAGIDISIDLC